ncbi:MAG: UDP-N-acetylmuramoyl-L-alanine--D-glutamate ligase, partial [Campylobacterota bacterium]
MTLFGHGKTTKAIARRFGGCAIFDDGITEITTDEYGNRLYPGSAFDPAKSRLEITSPGIAPSHPLIQSARNLQSEYDLFTDSMPRSIWISGSNGKTTATNMTAHLLQNAQAGGNVGLPLADMDEKSDLWVLESSSFTLHYTKYAKPDLYLLLPITPDHLSWHGSMQAYEAAKLSPLKRMQEGELALLPRKYASVETEAFVVTYEGPQDLARYFGIDLKRIDFKGGFLLDALFALITQKVLFDRLDYDRINTFVLDAHRQEKLWDAKGRLWVNDSKATNVEAAISAVETFGNKKLLLILGGEDKGADMEPLVQMLPKTARLFAIGKNSGKIKALAAKARIPCEKSQTLKAAIKAVDTGHDKDSVALLSPAAASFDQFENFE